MATTSTVDPVCGMTIDPASARHMSEYAGETYYFCSAACKASFDAHPANHVAVKASTGGGAHGGHGAAAGHGGAAHAPTANATSDYFNRETAGLADALVPKIVDLRDGETFEMRATPIRKRIGDATVRMLGYNGSIPGPTLRVPRGAEVTVAFTNEMDLETTVHWHGLRHENRFDGVAEGPHRGMQRPVPPGGTFTYRLRFPDAGVFWYHPHVREDYAQEHGLYGAIIVTPDDASFWPPANGELSLMLDDILIEDGQVAPFRRSGSDHTAMGRFGNVMLTNGETNYALEVRRDEVVRLYLTNTANTRFFNFRIPGARLKVVGGDNGRVEQEEFVDEALVTPSERVVVDALFDRPGRLTMEHDTGDSKYVLGTVTVSEEAAEPSFSRAFEGLRSSEELMAERASLPREMERPPDKVLALVGVMPGMAHGSAGHATPGIEWEDTMEAMNRRSTPETMLWKLVDRETGAENAAIDWTFRLGERVKIRIVNEAASDHPMPHPFHIHGERFLVLSRDGEAERNLVWKDTVLVNAGETLDLLMEASNPGIWMAHCHIAEHLEAGMMFSFEVA